MTDPLSDLPAAHRDPGRCSRERDAVDVVHAGAAADGLSPASAPPHRFVSLLYEKLPDRTGEEPQDRSFVFDLHLGQIVESVADDWEERELLTSLFFRQLHDIDTICYRQEVFADMEDRSLFERMTDFAERMRQVRTHLATLAKMQSPQQRQGWFLDAAAIYCDAVQSLADDLGARVVQSRALLAFRDFLDSYVTSPEFLVMAKETKACREVLAQVRYCMLIRGGRVDVSRYDGEVDYSIEVLNTFERFKQGAVKDYLVPYRMWPGMNHVGAQVLTLVARLFEDEFAQLDEYCRRHTGFLDDTIRLFERELQFYLAYDAYIAPLRGAGLPFCYPQISMESKEIFAANTFDVTLARKLVSEDKPVVVNDFHLAGLERVFVVSGPNQGGKTTFARTFGQLHHLASLGCPVPGSAARLFSFDHLFTHFEREEDLARMRGKLEDDLVRIGQVLRAATPDSIVILNEIFTSTTLNDARYLGRKVMDKVIQLGLLCVYVTFVEELASLDESVVSMVSTIVPEDPAQRTYKVVRAPADGLAYALAIAEKYNLTYERLRHRVAAR